MGGVQMLGELSSRPGQYSDDSSSAVTYGDYEASYRQNRPGADTVQYGNHRLQMGVKLLEDVDPGPNQGDMYVLDHSNHRLYFTKGGKMLPDANTIISRGKFYGNGPAVSWTNPSRE